MAEKQVLIIVDGTGKVEKLSENMFSLAEGSFEWPHPGWRGMLCGHIRSL